MSNSLDLTDEIFAEIADQNFAEDRIDQLQSSTHSFVQAFPEINDDYNYCIAKLLYLAENFEMVAVEHADHIHRSLNQAETAWNRIQSLQDSEGASLHQKTLAAVEEIKKQSSGENQSSFSLYSECFTTAVGAMELPFAQLRQNRTIVRDLLENIYRCADLLAQSRVLLAQLEAEDELFLYQGLLEDVEEHVQDSADQRHHTQLLAELEEFFSGWFALFPDAQEDFAWCVSRLNEVEDQTVFEQYYGEVYALMSDAEQSWEKISSTKLGFGDEHVSLSQIIISGVNPRDMITHETSPEQQDENLLVLRQTEKLLAGLRRSVRGLSDCRAELGCLLDEDAQAELAYSEEQ